MGTPDQDTGGDAPGRRAADPAPGAGRWGRAARRWWAMGLRVKDEARRDDLSLVAAGIAFFGLLSLAPALAAVVSIYGLVASPVDVQRHAANLSAAIPAEARQLIQAQLDQIVRTSGPTKGIGLVVGIAVALWSASAATRHLIVALSAMYDEDEDRGFVQVRLRALLLTVGGVVFLVVAVLLLAVAPAWVDAVGGGSLTALTTVLRWPVLMALMMGALAVLYRVGPDRAGARWRWTSWGAALATLVWIVASLGFSFYSSNLANYTETYGSMAVVVVTMVWLWITALCVLLGAEVNADLEARGGGPPGA